VTFLFTVILLTIALTIIRTGNSQCWKKLKWRLLKRRPCGPFEHGSHHDAADPSRRFPFRRIERRAGGACQWTRARLSSASVARHGFGTVYDVSTIAILWFAGASAMAGLLNIRAPLPAALWDGAGMDRAARPLVLIYTAIGFAVTLFFRANVDAQGGAYATGVLVLMTSAAVAVTLSAWRAARPVAGLCLALGVSVGRQRVLRGESAACHLFASTNCGFDEGEAWHRMPTVILVNRRVEA
jgi:hypothetical protein